MTNSNAKLTILIPTLHKRQQLFQCLNQHLTKQIQDLGLTDSIQILPLPNNGSASIGSYRNRLIKLATSEYVVFIDDDDWVTDDYVSLMWEALQQSPDVVTICGWMTTDDKSRVDWVIKLGEAYEERGGKYYRYPNHLCALRREHYLKLPFREIHAQEDYHWATDARDKGLLKTEVHIPKMIYHYRFKIGK